MDNHHFTTVPYNTNYLPQIIQLWSEQYDLNETDKRMKLFEWICSENPFMDEEFTYLLLLDQERTVGMHGRMPLWFSIYGKRQRGYFAHDVLLSRDYRGKGLGKIILNETFNNDNNFSGALWFNEPNYRLYGKCNWLDVPGLSSFVKIIDPLYFLKDKIRGKISLKVTSFVLAKMIQLRNMLLVSSVSDNVKIVETDKFNEKADKFFNKVAPQYGIMVARSSKYLNWKFVDKPFNNYRKFIAFNKSGEMSGYLVMKSEFSAEVSRVKFVDFLVDPNDATVFTALINFCCNIVRDKNIDYFQLTTSSTMISSMARKEGFVKARKPVRFMVKNWEKFFEETFISKINNWYITGSDGDGDAWTVDI